MITNRTKAKLAAGEAVIGCFNKSTDPGFTEFMAMSDWDFVVMDGEHGLYGPAEFANGARALELRGVTPIARVNTNEPSAILRALDAGAHGVHVPWVNSAEEAERAVQSVKYGPRGLRGLAGNRSIDFAATADTTARANAETMVIIHIETGTAVDAIDDYLDVDGIDVLFIGPTDLSHSLGHPGDKTHPVVLEAMDKVAAAVVPSDKTLGIFTATAELVVEWKAKGARYFTAGVEGLLKSATDAFMAQARN